MEMSASNMPDNEGDSEAVPEKNHIRSPGRRTLLIQDYF